MGIIKISAVHKFHKCPKVYEHSFLLNQHTLDQHVFALHAKLVVIEQCSKLLLTQRGNLTSVETSLCSDLATF